MALYCRINISTEWRKGEEDGKKTPAKYTVKPLWDLNQTRILMGVNINLSSYRKQVNGRKQWSKKVFPPVKFNQIKSVPHFSFLSIKCNFSSCLGRFWIPRSFLHNAAEIGILMSQNVECVGNWCLVRGKLTQSCQKEVYWISTLLPYLGCGSWLTKPFTPCDLERMWIVLVLSHV